MNLEALLAAGGRTVRAGLVGAGAFGASFAFACRRVPGLELVALCDLEPERARAAWARAGYPPDEVVAVESEAEAARGVEAGRRVVAPDPSVLVRAPLDVVVEATGDPEAAAVTALAALEHGRHLALATKEADSVIGPLLHARAREAGLVYTPVDGDQPSLLIGLVSRARRLGLTIVAAGKSSEYDLVLDLERERVDWRGEIFAAPGLPELWSLPEADPRAALARRSEILAAVPQRTVPDLCEMALVANATGLAPDVPELHAPVARPAEIPALLRHRAQGGILAREGAIDVFNCLRRPDELSFAGGVFVVVACEDRDTWGLLREKGHVVTPDLRHAMLFNPQHLLGVEAPISVLSAVLLGHSTGGLEHLPRFDLVARAGRPLAAGEVLAITDPHHHEVAALEPLLVPAGPATPDRPLPYYLAAGRPLARAVAAGEVLTGDAVVPAPGSVLRAARAAQDERFFGGG